MLAILLSYATIPSEWFCDDSYSYFAVEELKNFVVRKKRIEIVIVEEAFLISSIFAKKNSSARVIIERARLRLGTLGSLASFFILMDFNLIVSIEFQPYE